MGWETEEVKSLIVLGGLPTVGFVIGSVVAQIGAHQDMTAAGVGALIGAVISISLVIHRIYVTLKKGIF